MFDDDTTAFLRSGCALIVATVDADGAPHATRGWGLDGLDGSTASASERQQVRLLLDASDVTGAEHLGTTGRIAITAADVRTLRSLQLKGRVLHLEPASTDDRREARRYCDAFFTDIEQTDGTARDLLERIVPADFLVCTVEVESTFDQTPGPGAGQPIGAGR